MYYPDLQPYDDLIYPNILSIGWLDFHHDFIQGNIDNKLIEKLAYLTSLADEQYDYEFEKAPETALVIHTRYVRRGLPFCKTEIVLNYNGIETILGYNQMRILNKKRIVYMLFQLCCIIIYSIQLKIRH